MQGGPERVRRELAGGVALDVFSTRRPPWASPTPTRGGSVVSVYVRVAPADVDAPDRPCRRC